MLFEKYKYLVCATAGSFFYRYRHTAFRRAKDFHGLLYERVNGAWVLLRDYSF